MLLSNVKLTPKLIIIGVLLTGLPLLIVASMTIHQNNNMVLTASEENLKTAYKDLDHIIEGVFSMCHAQQELLQKHVNSSLNVARKVIKGYGSVRLSPEKENWTIINQYTKEKTNLDIPRLKIGDIALEKNYNKNVESILVDEVRQLVDATCTVFQKINEQGDMLRVSTNVLKNNGERAVGTYIPRINPDGRQNPVVASLLKKETFRGRAFVVNQWYITAYEPILDINKNVIGALYVGAPQESVESLRKAIIATEVGEDGYVYVLDSKGHYIISQGGKRDGENLWEAKDQQGNFFIQELCKKGIVLDENTIGKHTYFWKGNGEIAKEKIIKFKYFKDWDWIICAGTYIEDFYASKYKLESIGKKGNMKFGSIFILTLITSVISWFFISNSITRPLKKGIDFASTMSSGDFSQHLKINRKDETGILANALNTMTKKLRESFAEVVSGVDILNSASGQLVNMSEELTDELKGASKSSSNATAKALDMTDNMTSVAANMEQASTNVQQISISSREMNVTINEIAKSSSEAGEITDAAVMKFQAVSETMKSLDESTQSINAVTEKITEISEQTNLLALNATIEAARAGEAGRGFAVVAGEIKELSSLTAKATFEIKEKVKDIQETTGVSVEEIKSVSGVINDVREIITSIIAAMEEQSVTTDEIAQNVDQASKGISDTSNNVSQASVLVQDVATDIQQIHKSSDVISDRSGDLNANADNLIQLANDLNKSMKKFTI